MVDLSRPAHGDHRRQVVAGGVERVDVQLAGVQPAGLGAGVGQVAERPGRQVVDDVDRLALGDQRSTRCEPMNPAPPMTSTAAGARRGWSGTASVAWLGDPGVVDVLTVGNHGVGADHGANDLRAVADRAGHDRVLDDRAGDRPRRRAAAPNR